MQEETIDLSIVVRPKMHYSVREKFEAAFPQLEHDWCGYHYRDLNEIIYEIPPELRDKGTSFLQEMQEGGEIEEFFFNDQPEDPLESALIALRRAETQNRFQSDEVVQCIIAAVKAAKESEKNNA